MKKLKLMLLNFHIKLKRSMHYFKVKKMCKYCNFFSDILNPMAIIVKNRQEKFSRLAIEEL